MFRAAEQLGEHERYIRTFKLAFSLDSPSAILDPQFFPRVGSYRREHQTGTANLSHSLTMPGAGPRHSARPIHHDPDAARQRSLVGPTVCALRHGPG